MPDSSPIQHGSFAESLARLQSEYDHSDTKIRPQQESLPPVPNNQADWEHFRNKPALKAYRQDLLNLTTQARQFLLNKAQPGKGRQRALDGLQTYENGRIKADSRHLKAITFGLNRTNLRHLCALLENEQIPIEERSSVAIELFGSLGVCGEGEALNIQSAIESLQSRTQGLAAKILQAKNQMIDQHLLALVRHESRGFNNAKMMEIHHVQGLKNAVADNWGLVAREDRNIKPHFQEGVAPVAHALLAQTVTPQMIADVVADQLHQTLEQNLPNTSKSWMTYNQQTIHTLNDILKVEYGLCINLPDVLETTEDFSQFRLKGPNELRSAVINAMEKLGLTASIAPNEVEPVVPLQRRIEALSHLKNMHAFNQINAPHEQFDLSSNALPIGLPSQTVVLSDDERRRRRLLDGLGAY